MQSLRESVSDLTNKRKTSSLSDVQTMLESIRVMQKKITECHRYPLVTYPIIYSVSVLSSFDLAAKCFNH